MWRVRGVWWSMFSVDDLSWKAKRGMKPGEEGGIEPTMFFLRWRRWRKQKAKRRATALRIPSGIPTPNPIFWVRVRPGVLATGASGVDVDVDVGEDAEDDWLMWDWEEVCDEDDALDGFVDEKEEEDEIDVTKPDELLFVVVVAHALLSPQLFVALEVPGPPPEDTALETPGHEVTEAPPLALTLPLAPGGGVGFAVLGPNFLIR